MTENHAEVVAAETQAPEVAAQTEAPAVQTEAAQAEVPAVAKAEPKRVVMRPDGFKEVRLSDGKEELVALPDEKFETLPKKFRDKHFDALRYVWGLGQLQKSQQRDLPILRQEVEAIGMEKTVLKQLQAFGYIDMPLVHLNRNQQSIGTRIAVVITPKGQGLINHVMGAIEGELAEAAPAIAETPAAETAPVVAEAVAQEVASGN
jgi:hypothetical protein